MSSVDQEEIVKFEKNADQWWNEDGHYKMLHQITPVRLKYIKEKIAQHHNFSLNNNLDSFKELSILDVGCGGGLISIPLAKLGAKVTAIDPNISNVDAAKMRATEEKAKADFKAETAEEHLIKNKGKYDVVISLEVIEHVSNPSEFMKNLCELARPGGMVIVSTLNRTPKSYMLAIIMAEYVMGMVPKKTHNYNKFVKPSELSNMINGTKFSIMELKGLKLELPWRKWQLSNDIDVNYFAYIG